MAAGGFSPYHCLWPDDAPAKCAGITPTPWVMMTMLGFVSYHQGCELLSPPPTTPLSVVFFGKKILHTHTPLPDVSVDALLPVVTDELTINSGGGVAASEFM